MNERHAVATDSEALLTCTAQIVSAYAANTPMTPATLNDVIGDVSRALARIGTHVAEGAVEAVSLVPAVPIKKSVSADFIICLEDGKKLKMLKRHLMGTYGMTPADYRTKWNLPRDYPMVAPNYAAVRSRLARSFGLGRSRTPSGSSAAMESHAALQTAPARRGRPRKTAVVDAPAPAAPLSPASVAPVTVKPAPRRGRPAKAAAV